MFVVIGVDYVCLLNVIEEYFSENVKDWRTHGDIFRLNVILVFAGEIFCFVKVLVMISSVFSYGKLFCFNMSARISNVFVQRSWCIDLLCQEMLLLNCGDMLFFYFLYNFRVVFDKSLVI